MIKTCEIPQSSLLSVWAGKTNGESSSRGNQIKESNIFGNKLLRPSNAGLGLQMPGHICSFDPGTSA